MKRKVSSMGSNRITHLGLYLCLTAMTLGLAACNQAPEITENDIEIIDDIGLVDLLDQEPDTVIVDVRQDFRYRLGHLPGAIHIPLPELHPDDPRFVDVEHVVVYGDGLRNTLSHAAAKKLLAGGNLLVSDFRGGFDLWKRNDHPIITSN